MLVLRGMQEILKKQKEALLVISVDLTGSNQAYLQIPSRMVYPISAQDYSARPEMAKLRQGRQAPQCHWKASQQAEKQAECDGDD